MDCAREYVENYLKSTDSLAYHSFNFVHSLSATLAEKKHLYATQYTEMKEVSAEEKERLSRERVAREKREYMEAAADKPVITALGEYGSWKPFRNNFRARQRNLRLRIRRLEVRQYYFQMAVEERNERRRIEALAEEERDRLFENDEKALEKEEMEKCNQTIASQQMVMNIVQSEYTETYQKHMENFKWPKKNSAIKLTPFQNIWKRLNGSYRNAGNFSADPNYERN